MQIGCGVYELMVRERRYLYFWHYETKGGRRRQIKDYVGPVDSPHTRDDAARLCEDYYRRMAHELKRAREASLGELRSLR